MLDPDAELFADGWRDIATLCEMAKIKINESLANRVAQSRILKQTK